MKSLMHPPNGLHIVTFFYKSTICYSCDQRSQMACLLDFHFMCSIITTFRQNLWSNLYSWLSDWYDWFIKNVIAIYCLKGMYKSSRETTIQSLTQYNIFLFLSLICWSLGDMSNNFSILLACLVFVLRSTNRKALLKD